MPNKYGQTTSGDVSNQLADLIRSLAVTKQQGQNEQNVQAMRGQQESQLEQLKNYLQGQTTERNVGIAKQTADEINKDRGPFGGRAGVSISGEGGAGITEQSPPITQIYGEQGREAATANKFVAGQIKPIKDGLDAAEQSLSALDLNTDVGFKQALMNEAKLYGGARGTSTLVKMLDPTGTVPGLAQQVTNFVLGKGDITATNEMKNNLRQAVYTRTSNLQKNYQNLKPQLQKQVSAMSPIAARFGGLDTSMPFSETDAQIGRIRQDAQNFTQQQTQPVAQGGMPMKTDPGYSQPKSVLSQVGNSFSNLIGSFLPSHSQSQGPQNTGSMRVRLKSSGQTGTIPQNEYDPNIYDKVQ